MDMFFLTILVIMVYLIIIIIIKKMFSIERDVVKSVQVFINSSFNFRYCSKIRNLKLFV